MAVRRNRLLARLFAAEPRLVRFVAGAGYGKSSLARIFARRFGRHSFCDCQDVTDVTEFANRALAALEAEHGDSDAITQLRLRLHVTNADSAAWSRALLDVWKSRGDQALFVLEHAEWVANSANVLAVVGDLLAARPPDRVVLVSSRVALPLRFAHYVAPHQTLTFSRNELRFENAEAEAVFEGSGLAPEVVQRIVRLADGWPVVLLLLARFAQYESAMDLLLERLGDLSDEDRFARLGNELLAAFTPEMTSAMLAAAAIPNATLDDIAAAIGIRDVMPIVDRLLYLPGFISAESGTYQVHPLLRGTLRAQSETEHSDFVQRAATAYERDGDFIRAAELHLLCGDVAAAAACLDRLPIEALQQPSARIVDVLTHVDLARIAACPNLWIATLPHRQREISTLQLYEEAAKLLTLPGAPAAIERRLHVRLAMLEQELGRFSEARGAIEASNVTRSNADPPEERRLALVALALVAAKQGKFAESNRLIEEAESVAGMRHSRLERERTLIAFERARYFGDWNDLQRMCEEELYAAQRGGDRARIIESARELRRAAWYRNDDAAFEAANELLADYGDPDAQAFPQYVAAAGARTLTGAPRALFHVAKVVAAMRTNDPLLAQQLLDEAIDGVDEREHAFPRIAYRVLAALLLPSERRRLAEAREIAQSIESPPLEASLELLLDNGAAAEYGIFKSFADRVATSPLKVHRDPVAIVLASGHVFRGGEQIHVSDRGFELLAALSLQSDGTSKEDLARTIWPELAPEASLNALKMCVSRTRTQLADREAIVNTKTGYALSDRIDVDVREYDRLLRTVRSAGALSGPLRREVEEAIHALSAGGRGYAAHWAWFSPYEAHLEELQRRFVEVLEAPLSLA